MQKLQNAMYIQQKLRSAGTYDQICCCLHKEALGPWLRRAPRKKKTLRMWSESSLGTRHFVIFAVISPNSDILRCVALPWRL